MLLLLSPACAPSAEPSAPEAWSWAETPDQPALLTAADLETAVDEAVTTVIAADPRAVPDAYTTTLGHVDADCPIREVSGPQTVTYGDCTTADGWTWYGLGLVSHIEDLDIEVKDIDAYHRHWDFSNGNTRVIGPSGQSVELTGTSWYRDWDDGDTHALTVEIWGDFATEGMPELGDPWFATPMGAELNVDMRIGRDSVWGTWTGGFSGLDGVAWAFTLDLYVDDDGGCTEPTGTVDVQDAAGTWYTLTFDGDTSCDGCGAAEGIGTVCADFSPLTEWRFDPWSG